MPENDHAQTLRDAITDLVQRFTHTADAVRAVEPLRQLSQDSNTRLVDIADQIVARGSS